MSITPTLSGSYAADAARIADAFKGINLKVDSGFAAIDIRFQRLEESFDVRFGKTDGRLDGIEVRLGKVEARLDRIDARPDRIESMLIDAVAELRGYRLATQNWLSGHEHRIGFLEIETGLVREDQSTYLP